MRAALILVVVAGSAGCTSSSAKSFDCKSPPSDLAACTTDTDCTTVLKECYCGSQPILGVAVGYESSDAACQAEAGMSCALGCANFPGFIAQDGVHADTADQIHVRCDTTTATCLTYGPPAP